MTYNYRRTKSQWALQPEPILDPTNGQKFENSAKQNETGWVIIWLAAEILYKQNKFIPKNKFPRHHTYQRGPAHSLGCCYIAIQKPCSGLIREETQLWAQLEFQILSIYEFNKTLGQKALTSIVWSLVPRLGTWFRSIVFKYVIRVEVMDEILADDEGDD